MKCILSFFIFSTFCLTLFSQEKARQTNYKISGRVIDSITKQPIEYATINLYASGNTKPIDGNTSTKNGSFSLDNLPAIKAGRNYRSAS